MGTLRCPTLDADAFAAALAAERRPVVLDIRSTADFEAGHVPGARNVPVHDLGRRQHDLPSSKVARILVIGDPGRRTEAGAAFLSLMGYADLAVVEGGIAGYRGELETGPERPRASHAGGPELRVIP